MYVSVSVCVLYVCPCVWYLFTCDIFACVCVYVRVGVCECVRGARCVCVCVRCMSEYHALRERACACASTRMRVRACVCVTYTLLRSLLHPLFLVSITINATGISRYNSLYNHCNNWPPNFASVPILMCTVVIAIVVGPLPSTTPAYLALHPPT